MSKSVDQFGIKNHIKENHKEIIINGVEDEKTKAMLEALIQDAYNTLDDKITALDNSLTSKVNELDKALPLQGNLPGDCYISGRLPQPFYAKDSLKRGIYLMPSDTYYFGSLDNSILLNDPWLFVYKDYSKAEEREPFAHIRLVSKKDDANRTYSFAVLYKSSTSTYGFTLSTSRRTSMGMQYYTMYGNLVAEISATHTYTTLPQSAKTPTSANQFTNKQYVDDTADSVKSELTALIDTKIQEAISNALGGEY